MMEVLFKFYSTSHDYQIIFSLIYWLCTVWS